MALDPNQFMDLMKKRMVFTEEDQSTLKAQEAWGLEIAPEMAEVFYDYLGADEEMNAILNATEGRVHRLRETFVKWFHQMFTGVDDWGDEYAGNRWHIGLIHVKIGIGPQHVVPAMATVVRAVEEKVQSTGKNDELHDSLSKICMIDLAFIEQAYVEVAESAVLRETGWTSKLFQRLISTGANSMN